MLPKKGIVFPSPEDLGSFSLAIAYALKCELGSTHQAVKIIMRWTGAGERTVKNWMAGISGPSGQHLVDLIRHSDNVLEVLLVMAGRQQIIAAHNLIEVRDKLAETVAQIDVLMREVDPGRTSAVCGRATARRCKKQARGNGRAS